MNIIFKYIRTYYTCVYIHIFEGNKIIARTVLVLYLADAGLIFVVYILGAIDASIFNFMFGDFSM